MMNSISKEGKTCIDIFCSYYIIYHPIRICKVLKKTFRFYMKIIYNAKSGRGYLIRKQMVVQMYEKENYGHTF